MRIVKSTKTRKPPLSAADCRILDRIPMSKEVRAQMEQLCIAESQRQATLVRAIRTYLTDELASDEIAVSPRRLKAMADKVLTAAIMEVAKAIERKVKQLRARLRR